THLGCVPGGVPLLLPVTIDDGGREEAAQVPVRARRSIAAVDVVIVAHLMPSTCSQYISSKRRPCSLRCSPCRRARGTPQADAQARGREAHQPEAMAAGATSMDSPRFVHVEQLRPVQHDQLGVAETPATGCSVPRLPVRHTPLPKPWCGSGPGRCEATTTHW